MHRNTIIAICAGFCAVAVIAGLLITNLSTNNRLIIVAQATPLTASATSTAPTGIPTNATMPASQATVAAPTAPTSIVQDVPTSTLTATDVLTSTVTIAPAPVDTFITYTVQRGDELLVIAKKFNVTAKDILANNQIDNADSLRIGQVLRIPKK